MTDRGEPPVHTPNSGAESFSDSLFATTGKTTVLHLRSRSEEFYLECHQLACLFQETKKNISEKHENRWANLLQVRRGWVAVAMQPTREEGKAAGVEWEAAESKVEGWLSNRLKKRQLIPSPTHTCPAEWWTKKTEVMSMWRAVCLPWTFLIAFLTFFYIKYIATSPHG